ncbi:hypothetical protein M7I_5679 [Glarea lozoyensis 74030]|uniref:Uncharacterized protein n=1 Tax=Glarea lozoyensis (strain ATCC 74030 / MF5533) TaxID=1104152 RepID=H0ESJ0_GLAL7|nr:hypothetical protein M7I_5679 [Glarea lozoyensis 74030]
MGLKASQPRLVAKEQIDVWTKMLARILQRAIGPSPLNATSALA